MKLTSGHPVIHFERIDSTNAEARRLAEAGERGPLWIVADEQTGGRGRMGRTWVSEPGNLYATFLLATAAAANTAAQVSFVAALAVHDMVRALKPEVEPRIKWPNDVLLDGAKFCGVLSEVVGQSPTAIAIGCGINIAHAPKGTPYPVTCLTATTHQEPRHPGENRGPAASGFPAFAGMTKMGERITVELVLQELHSTLSNRLQIWDDGKGFEGIRSAWLAQAFGLGGPVTAQLGTSEVHGTFRSIAPDGALLMTLGDGTTKPIHSGEVRFAEHKSLRRP